MRKFLYPVVAAVVSVCGIVDHASAAVQASAVLKLISTGGTPSTPTYTYDIKLTNTGNTPLGTFWYAWVPGEDFLKTSPLSITNPTNWGDAITGGPLPTNGFAIQWIASAGGAVPVGGSLDGFQYTTTDNLASVSGNSAYYATTPVPTSFVYSGGPFSDAGFQFLVTTVVPEPTTLALLAAVPMLTRRRRA